jgi:hypothetical protein
MNFKGKQQGAVAAGPGRKLPLGIGECCSWHYNAKQCSVWLTATRTSTKLASSSPNPHTHL